MKPVTTGDVVSSDTSQTTMSSFNKSSSVSIEELAIVLERLQERFEGCFVEDSVSLPIGINFLVHGHVNIRLPLATDDATTLATIGSRATSESGCVWNLSPDLLTMGDEWQTLMKGLA